MDGAGRTRRIKYFGVRTKGSLTRMGVKTHLAGGSVSARGCQDASRSWILCVVVDLNTSKFLKYCRNLTTKAYT